MILTRLPLGPLVAAVVLAACCGSLDVPSAGAAADAAVPAGTIAFVCEQDDHTNDELCVMDTDGGRVQRLTENPGPDRAPDWSPDGTQLVFNSRRDPHPTQPQIYALDVATLAATRLTTSAVEDQRASWAPDGESVVFQRGTFATGFSLFRHDVATGTEIQLTDVPGKLDAAGSLSPDGTRLVFQSNRDVAGLFPFSTYVTDLLSGSTVRIAQAVTSSHDGPRFSPSGNRVVFAAGGDLHVANLLTGTVDTVLAGDPYDSSPDWSPDGSQLVFQSDRLDADPDDDHDETSLHVLDLASGQVVDLGFGRTPVWTATVRPDPIPTFSDVPLGHPFFEDVEWLAAEGISTGFADGTFRPASPVSRQSMAAFLHRLAGSPHDPPSEATFGDVGTTHPFFAEVEWLAAEGISTGFADGTFRPASAVSRQAMAAFLQRFADADGSTPPSEATFSDVGTTHPFFAEVEWLAAEGISTGFADGTFRPASAVSRQAMAAFLHRVADAGLVP